MKMPMKAEKKKKKKGSVIAFIKILEVFHWL